MGTLPSVKNILVLDSEGKRVAVKYYTDDWSSLSSKLAFEKSVFTKTMKINARNEGNVGGLIPVHGTKIWYSQKLESADIVMFDGHIVIFKFIQDLHFFVTGGDDENELILASVLQDVFDAVGTILRNNVEKRTALENLDLIYLCLDEVVDGGMILETDSSVIAEKVSTASGVDTSAPFSEQTLSQAFAVAREHFARSLLK